MSQQPSISLPILAAVLVFCGLAFGFTIAVILGMARRSRTPRQPAGPTEPNLEAECLGVMARQGKIAAIKLYRERTGFGLKEAKDYVDLLEASQPVGHASGLPPGPPPEDDADLRSEIEVLVLAGRKLEAIKVYRERHGCGLKQAKDVVDAIEAGLGR